MKNRVAIAFGGALTLLVLGIAGVLAQAPGGGPPPGGEPMRLPVIVALDQNGDGAISGDEMAAAAESLKKLDQNGDGTLSREELRPRLGPGGPGGPGEGRRGPRPGGSGASGDREQGSTAFVGSTHPKDDAEGGILKVLEAIQAEQGRRLNVPVQDARLLRLLAESIGAKTVVEFGTSNGISAIWIAMALKKTDGHLFTHEIDPDTAELARENFERAGVADRVTVVVGDGHEKAKDLQGPIDMVFIDADKEGYLDYFRQTLPLVRPGGLILAHNMTPRMADPAFLKEITTNPDVETLFYLDGGGMSVTLKKR